ncbi:MAG TPA: PAS domain-containing protein [Xanthobacteraceae bacterium]|nr:PAS domain-containing protein [Xanthobacteraceae bacterium]
MSIVEKEFALLRHPRLTPLATGAWPAWLWSSDGAHIVWANAVGAAILGDATVARCSQRSFAAGDTRSAQIVRMAPTLPSSGQERLERLRGFGAAFGRALTCACSRIVLADGNAGVLLAAVEPAGLQLSLGERVHRLFSDCEEPIAAFTPDGTLLYANAAGQSQLVGATLLSALGIETLAATVLETGSGSGTARIGQADVHVAGFRLGKDASRVLLLTMPQQPGKMPEEQIENAPQVLAPTTASAETANAAPAAAPITPEAELTTGATQQEAPGERRHPLRFVWHMDADGRFGVGSDEFIELAGPRTSAAFGRPWSEIAAELKLDPTNQVARAVASQETWSGIVLPWPVDDSAEPLPVELSGLPVFDRDRKFRGYRGFGVCRDVIRINRLAQVRRAQPMGLEPAPEGYEEKDEASGTTPQMPTAIADQPEAAAANEPATPTLEQTPSPPERLAPAAAPASANVVPFRPSTPAEPRVAPTLSPVERRAFRELAQELTARLRGPEEEPAADGRSAEALPVQAVEAGADAARMIEQVLLDRIPIGVLVYRHDKLLYANRHFLEWSGYGDLAAIEAAGSLTKLFAEPAADTLAEAAAAAHPSLKSLSIVTRRGDKLAADGRMFTVPWNGAAALALVLSNGSAEAAARYTDNALAGAEKASEELRAILDAATDGVVTLNAEGHVVGANTRAAALFGRTAADLAGRSLGDLFAPESERAARDHLDRFLRGAGTVSDVIEVAARTGEDRLVPLAMTLTRVGGDRICAVFRDITGRKQSEEELRNAKREALRAASAKAEFIAKVSHEIRTPLNAMTGFAEVIMAERFGPIGNERYREYIKDIHGAGTHLVSMLNDLLDLSRIETGQIELAFANVNLNELTQQCVGIMQPQANRARIIIRTSLTPGLPLVVADERSLRQIVLNLITNSIKFTGPGGQVIVSTVFTDSREAVLRVRDTGSGMSEKDIAAALEPFRQVATSGTWGSGGSSFGLPLTKALAEANRANFSIKSAPNAGTLVEIAFPPSRIVAD